MLKKWQWSGEENASSLQVLELNCSQVSGTGLLACLLVPLGSVHHLVFSSPDMPQKATVQAILQFLQSQLEAKWGYSVPCSDQSTSGALTLLGRPTNFSSASTLVFWGEQAFAFLSVPILSGVWAHSTQGLATSWELGKGAPLLAICTVSTRFCESDFLT